MSCIHLATALVRREESILLVASRYPNHAHPLWNMPGGRQKPGELLEHTVLRELREETGLDGEVRDLCYVSESYDGAQHFTNFTFLVDAAGEPHAQPSGADHIVGCEWVALSKLGERLSVRVVREPLLAYLGGAGARYAGYPEAGITVVFPD